MRTPDAPLLQSCQSFSPAEADDLDEWLQEQWGQAIVAGLYHPCARAIPTRS